MKYHKTKIKLGPKLIIILTILIAIYLIFIPKIKLNAKEITINLNESYTPSYSASSFKQDITKNVQVTNNVDTTKVGTYTNKFELKIGIFDIVELQKITVVDNIAPEITLEGPKEINICSLDKYEEPGYIATDNYDGDLTDKVEVTKNERFIYYKVYDSSNNESSAGRVLHIKDEDAPTITLNGPSKTEIALNTFYEEEGATAYDNCDGDITSKIKITGNVDITTTGTYQITYQVEDQSGNITTVKRTITVFDPKENQGIIYLTFDDGPGSYTKDILDILDKYNVKATFFVTNNGSDEILQEEYLRGHTIGLHTATHSWNIYNSVDSYFNDLNIVQSRVERVTGTKSKFIRFPGGSSNTVSKSHSKGIMTTLSEVVQEKGYKYYDWNVSVEDAGACARSGVSDRQTCVLNYFKSGLSKNRINMVLLHDIKSYTASSLENMIKYALNNGYIFKAIDDTTPMIHQRLNN